MTVSVLVVDDDEEMCRMLEEGLRRHGYAPAWTTTADDAFDRVMAGRADVVVTDLRMRGMNGLDLCSRVADNRPDVPVIVMTAFGDLETAIGTIRAGAFDFLTKPLDADTLVLAVERAITQRTLREEVKRLRESALEPPAPGAILGDSVAIRKVQALVERVARSDSTVLVTGESGTGKELVARSLHLRSGRRAGPFVAINCAAMPETLLENELFGHEKGAFTDARDRKEGLFAQASGGTLLLDEVGEMPLAMQAKLLRALETRSVRLVGGAVEVPFDARVVASTNKDLHLAVHEHRFREDLLYRLDVIEIEIPPLRARRSDVLPLAQHFLAAFAARAKKKKVTGLASPAAGKLMAYAWPGNVRELQNCMERAVALAEHEQITVEDLPERIRSYRSADVVVASDDPRDLVSMEEVERRYALRVLEAVGGNKNMAARILGWDRKTLYRRLERWELAARRSS